MNTKDNKNNNCSKTEQTWNTISKEEKITRILAMKAEGYTNKQIGEYYGVSEDAVKKTLQRNESPKGTKGTKRSLDEINSNPIQNNGNFSNLSAESADIGFLTPAKHKYALYHINDRNNALCYFDRVIDLTFISFLQPLKKIQFWTKLAETRSLDNIDEWLESSVKKFGNTEQGCVLFYGDLGDNDKYYVKLNVRDTLHDLNMTIKSMTNIINDQKETIAALQTERDLL